MHEPTFSVDPTASVADPAATTGGAADATTSTPPPPSAGRYQLGAEIARGGMGAVYRAADAAFGREVAVKVLLDKYAPTSGTARRFHDEARITGQLQHPGIPPAHDLGTLPDGRPFLAMKLIKGDTLDELLKSAADPSPNPLPHGERGLLPPFPAREGGTGGVGSSRGRLVAAFEKVCEAVAYAHAHGVVHRDLKPQNVMVGAFGEVQVMDWGLAKVLGERPRAIGPSDDPDETSAGTEIRSLRDSEDLLTQAGSVLGTPAYMPPEQALGAVHEVDARSDVFGLGGILAAVLTGRPPFVGDTAETTRVMVVCGEVDGCFRRLDASGADPELVALGKRCLAPRREDRPADGGEVAREVAALRQAADDRARQAELDRVKAEGEKAAAEAASAERRKRRRVWVVAAVALAVAVVGGLSAVLEVQRRAGQDLEARNQALSVEQAKVEQRNAALEAERRAAEAARSEADAQRQKADARLIASIDTIEAMIRFTAAEVWWSDPLLIDERRRLLAAAAAFYEKLGAGDAADPVVQREGAKAQLRAARAWLAVGEHARGEAACRRAVALSAARADNDPASAADARSTLGQCIAVKGDYPAALAEFTAALGLAERAVAADPAAADPTLTLVRVRGHLANFHLIADPPRAVAEATAAVALAAKLAAAPDVPLSYTLAHVEALVTAATAQLAGQRHADAAASLDRAAAVFDTVGKGTPARAARVTPEQAETMLYLKGQIDIQRGALRMATAGGKADLHAAVELFRSGLKSLDLLLKVQPKAFPYRLTRYYTLGAVAEPLAWLGDFAGRDQATTEMDKLGAEILTDSPTATWVPASSIVRRSLILVRSVQAGDTAGFPKAAAELRTLADKYPSPGMLVRYNLACAYALVAGEENAASAVRLLEGLQADGYFRRPQSRELLAEDTDLDSLRGRQDFKALYRKVMGGNPAPPRRRRSPRRGW